MMKIGVIGLGSMGKRRVRDLLALGYAVFGFDIRPDRNAAAEGLFKITTAESLEGLIAHGVQALVISTPPDQHFPYYEKAFEARLPFFSEASIFVPPGDWFREREARAGIKSYPSATLRFHPLLGHVAAILDDVGRRQVNSIFAHYGSYLPYWHPWEHYGEYYAGRDRRTCAAREMVTFEMEWLCHLLGPVSAVCCVHGRQSDEWVTDIDDFYSLLLEFQCGIQGTLLVEMNQISPVRVGRISARNHTFELDLAEHKLRIYDKATDSWRFIKPASVRTLDTYQFEQLYFVEMQRFTSALAFNEPYPKEWNEDRHLSDILYAAEESSRRRAWVHIAEIESAYDGVLVTEQSAVNPVETIEAAEVAGLTSSI